MILGPLDAVPLGEGRTFDVEGTVIAVFRTRHGCVHATAGSCPHRGGPLADGILGGTTVVCPLHGLAFDVATGEAIGNACGPIATYPISVSEERQLLLQIAGDP